MLLPINSAENTNIARAEREHIPNFARRAISALALTSMLASQTPNTEPLAQYVDSMASSTVDALDFDVSDSLSYLKASEGLLLLGVGVISYIALGGQLPSVDIPEVQIPGETDESIRVSVEGTKIYENDIYIPMTVVSRVGVQVRENEAGLFDFMPFVDGGPSWGTQKVDLYGVGDVDIAIDGRVEIYRDEVTPTTIHVNISTFRTWRPRLRMESLEFNPDGDEMSGLIGEPSTRDRATKAALVAMQTLVANEGCRAASEALIKEDVIAPVVREIIASNQMRDFIEYDPSRDDIKIVMSAPPEENALATKEEFREYYTSDQTYSNRDTDEMLTAPQLGQDDALDLLADLADEVDKFTVVDGAGETLNIEQLIERRTFCEQNVLGEVVDINVGRSGEPFVGDRDTLTEGNVAQED